MCCYNINDNIRKILISSLINFVSKIHFKYPMQTRLKPLFPIPPQTHRPNLYIEIRNTGNSFNNPPQ